VIGKDRTAVERRHPFHPYRLPLTLLCRWWEQRAMPQMYKFAREISIIV
jgi:hypothetical protein